MITKSTLSLTVDACLASLKKLNYPNYEVVVVNDGSTDGTRQIAEGYSYVRLINQENKGLSEARNVGIRAAAGEIIAFTDADCMADADWLIGSAHALLLRWRPA